MPIEYVEVVVPRDEPALLSFLCSDEWPFHGTRAPAPEDVGEMDFRSDDVASFWVRDGGETVGLVRLMDLGDIGEGAPVFDLRIAGRHRGRGYGRLAVAWLVDHLFTAHPDLHRIEATTRADNAAMQRVFAVVGFTREGTLRDAWRGDDGRWFDTLVYGILRREWSSPDEAAAAS